MDLTALASAFDDEATALIRTDHTDDAAWSRIQEAISSPVDTTGDGEADVTPHVTPLDDESFAGATGDTLASAIRDAGDAPLGYALLADSRSMAESAELVDLTLAYVDLSCPDEEDADLFNTFLGRTFRVAVPEVAGIEENLSLGNMDFSDFADYADERGGVFRGFTQDD